MKTGKRVKATLLLGGLPLATLVWGFSMARYEVFPFPQIEAIKRHFASLGSDYRLSASKHPYWEMKASHFRLLDSRPEIVMLGDSITADGEWQEMLPMRSVVNRGISGDTTAGLLRRLDEVVDRRPKAVFLMIGINDVRMGATAGRILKNYREIVGRLEAEGIEVFVQSTIFPGGNGEAGWHRQVSEINEGLKALCRSREGVTFIDLNPVLAPVGVLDPGYTLDGIHLNGRAYQEWLQLIRPTVDQAARGSD